MRAKVVLAAMAAASVPALALAQAQQAAPPAPGAAKAAAATPPPGKTVGEVVVSGEAPPVRTAIDRKSYGVAGDLRATSGSIGDALRNVPSVEVDVQGNISLRGDSNVTVLIDGKPSSQFSGESRAQALQSLPAERIDRVEVITNPSAEFRADGAAGIINLVTKRAKGQGLTAGARLSVGNSGQIFGGGNLGYNSGRLAFTADGFLRHDVQKQTLREDRFRPDPAGGGDTETDIDSVQHVIFNNAGGRAAIDYDVSAKTRLNGELRVQGIDFELSGLTATVREDAGGGVVQAFDRGFTVDQKRGNGELTVGLTHKFDGDMHDLKLSLSYEITEEDRTRAGFNVGNIPAFAPQFDRQHVLTSLRQFQAKGDYQRPMPGGARLKAGFDLQVDDNSYDNRGFRGLTGPARIPDATLTNLFEFDQTIAQAYVTYERSFGDLTVLAGLRLEDVRIDVDQVTLGQTAENDYAKAYPSLHLGWKASEHQTLTASYSHRVQRPQPEQFNSFRFLLDPITFRAGNTRLKPQETHSFEAGYQYRKSGQVYLVTAYFRENLHNLTEVSRDVGGGVYVISTENLSKTRDGGVELVANGRLTKSLTYNVSGNAFFRELDASALGFTGKRTGVSVSGRGSLNWQVDPNDFVQLSGFLQGRVLTPQGSVSPTGMLNIGYRHKFDDRLALVVQAQDVLNTFSQKIKVDSPALKDTVRRGVDATLMTVGFSWTLGGGRQRDPGFEFQQGGGPPPQ